MILLYKISLLEERWNFKGEFLSLYMYPELAELYTSLAHIQGSHTPWKSLKMPWKSLKIAVGAEKSLNFRANFII